MALQLNPYRVPHEKWDTSGAADYLHLVGPGGAIVGGIDSSGAGQGSLATSAAASNSIGPVINVNNPLYGASPALADNATAFAAVAAAANAAAYASVGVPTIRSTVATAMSTSAIASATATVNISDGDTVLIGTIAFNPPVTPLSYTISDGVNTYYPVNLNSSPAGTGNEQVQVFGTAPGAAKAFSGTLTVTISAGGPAQFGFIVLDAFNVGSYGQTNLFRTANSAAPSVTAATQDNNNLIATWVNWCNATGVALTQNTGTLQRTWPSDATKCGGGLITNATALALTSLTTSGNLGAGSTWAVNGLELRSVTTLIPTVYFPAGRYTYTSGLNFTNPVTLKGEPGSVLCYAGTAHAIDLGPTNLTFAFPQVDYYTVDGLRFECGAGMTQGIVFANNAIFGEVKNSTFYNFGSTTSAAIFSNGDTQDLSVKLNKFLVLDGPPAPANVPSRKFVDLTTNSQFSTLTMTNNYAACIAGKLNAGVGCGTTSGPLISTSGYANIISNNSVGGGFCPAVQLGLTAPAPSTRIQNNNFEVDQAGCNAITYRSTNTDGLKVLNNFFSFKATGTALLGPADATQLLTNVEVSNNVLVNIPTNFPVVVQNNLAGQTNNTGWHNICSTGQSSGTTPCPLLHTLGGNINQWNNDYSGTCTLTAGACPVYNFLVAYAVAPKCIASWNGTGTFTGILKVASSTTQLTITDTVNESTGVINWSCNPEAQ